MPLGRPRKISTGAAAAVIAALALALYLASNPNATVMAATFLGALVGAGLIAATTRSQLLPVALLAAIGSSSLAFGAASMSWFGVVLTVIALIAVYGLAEAASRQAFRVIDWVGVEIGAIAGFAAVGTLFWLASP